MCRHYQADISGLVDDVHTFKSGQKTAHELYLHIVCCYSYRDIALYLQQ